MGSGRVNVLISLYNGEQFIEEQIDSIMKQTYPHYHIYIRDDGSSDSGIEKIKQYIPTGKITIVQGENIGYAKSFMELLRISSDGEYWAFCDQDDVWFPEKLQWAMDWIKQQDRDIPCLFHSAYENTDQELNHINYYSVPKYKYDFRRALTECLYYGFSMVFNKKLRELMLEANVSNIVSHDWWATLIAVKFGKCQFDKRVASQHRRHSESVTLNSLSRKWKWLFRSIKEGNLVGNNADEFERLFGQKLDKKERFYLQLFTKKNIKTALFKTFYLGRWRPSWDSELAIRLLMLLGKN